MTVQTPQILLIILTFLTSCFLDANCLMNKTTAEEVVTACQNEVTKYSIEHADPYKDFVESCEKGILGYKDDELDSEDWTVSTGNMMCCGAYFCGPRLRFNVTYINEAYDVKNETEFSCIKKMNPVDKTTKTMLKKIEKSEESGSVDDDSSGSKGGGSPSSRSGGQGATVNSISNGVQGGNDGSAKGSSGSAGGQGSGSGASANPTGGKNKPGTSSNANNDKNGSGKNGGGSSKDGANVNGVGKSGSGKKGTLNDKSKTGGKGDSATSGKDSKSTGGKNTAAVSGANGDKSGGSSPVGVNKASNGSGVSGSKNGGGSKASDSASGNHTSRHKRNRKKHLELKVNPKIEEIIEKSVPKKIHVKSFADAIDMSEKVMGGPVLDYIKTSTDPEFVRQRKLGDEYQKLLEQDAKNHTNATIAGFPYIPGLQMTPQLKDMMNKANALEKKIEWKKKHPQKGKPFIIHDENGNPIEVPAVPEEDLTAESTTIDPEDLAAQIQRFVGADQSDLAAQIQRFVGADQGFANPSTAVKPLASNGSKSQLLSHPKPNQGTILGLKDAIAKILKQQPQMIKQKPPFMSSLAEAEAIVSGINKPCHMNNLALSFISMFAVLFISSLYYA